MESLHESGFPSLQVSKHLIEKKDEFGNLPLGNVIKRSAGCAFAAVYDDSYLATLASEALQGVLHNAVFHEVEDVRTTRRLNQALAPGLGPLFVTQNTTNKKVTKYNKQLIFQERWKNQVHDHLLVALL